MTLFQSTLGEHYVKKTLDYFAESYSSDMSYLVTKLPKAEPAKFIFLGAAL